MQSCADCFRMMEEEVVRLISQYLHERGFTASLEALQTESGRTFNPQTQAKKTGELRSILDEHVRMEENRQRSAINLERLFQPGEGEYVNKLWCSYDDLTGGVNVLVVRLNENGVLAFGASKAILGYFQLPLPLEDTPPSRPITTDLNLCKGAVLSLDFHPTKRNLLLCGSMDRMSFLVDLDRPENPSIQKFQDHSKYVVRVLWSPSGKFFVTGSYDHSVSIYRVRDDSSGLYELITTLKFGGAVEGMDFAKDSDIIVVGVREDNLLHCYDLSSDKLEETQTINLNEFGDDYVSFVPLHISFSPDGLYLLVSTDRDRLIIYSWKTGTLVGNFYGASNDEYSQPRHCWDPSGKYIYSTSQDKSIVVWEIRSQSVIAHLEGHSGTVRDICFSKELGLLVSCGFDGSIKLWRHISQ